MAPATAGFIARTLRRVRPRAVFVVALCLAGAAALAFAITPLLDRDTTPPAGAASFQGGGNVAAGTLDEQGILDSDLDGLTDALENFAYGTDPQRWNTSGTPLPDGWLANHGYDPLDPSIAAHPAAVPPSSSLPAAYRNQWPADYTPTLLAVYSFGRPAEWNEAQQGPFDSGLDPTRWDTNGDGIPDGYLLRYGLDPKDKNISTRQLAGADGLSVREAFEHRTDPRSLDTDEDGITDREEIAGPQNPRAPDGPAQFPPTDPARWDSGGGGVCDGYLRGYGLDPNRPENSYQDLDRDGATTQQEFAWSRDHFAADACTLGRGLDPRRLSTINGPLPDGWLLRYGLDPLDAALASHVTQRATSDAGPSLAGAAGPDIVLTVQDEYRLGRPGDWDEARDGPWWGGTDPSKPDTDGDGLGDAWELRGDARSVTTETGPGTPQAYRTTSDPTRSDTDGDGLGDGAEYTAGTDPRRSDTDFDGLDDANETSLKLGLNPARADTAGDLLRDGERLTLLRKRAGNYADDLTYEFPGPPGVSRSVGDWAAHLRGAPSGSTSLGKSQVVALLGPEGDADGDGTKNIVDPDIDGDGLPNGVEERPTLYARSQFGPGDPSITRSASDPLNPDTDGDELLDGWEVRFASPDHVLGRYNLDPSRWDSDGDGKGDGDEDLDADGIVWYSFATLVQRRENEYAFTNLLEQQFETDPNRRDSDKDGLADGWKVFWSVVYPALGPTTSPSSGIYYPGAPPPNPLVIPAQAHQPVLGSKQDRHTAEVLILEASYERHVADPFHLRPGEVVAGQPINVMTRSGDQRTVHQVHGTVRYEFHDAQENRTNPYLSDTDGDLMPDWWEALHMRALPGTVVPPGSGPESGKEVAGCVDAAGPDPTVPDGGVDTDRDGLVNRDEYASGTNPLCADSDLGGLLDGQEVHLLGIDPSDPADDRTVLDRALDTDQDRLLDFEELTGTVYQYLGPEPVRTDPTNPDSDGDGLLDGHTVPPPSQGSGLAAADPLTAKFLDLGIAYYVVNGNEYYFQGELDSSADPRNPDDSGTGVPAGWLFAHGRSPTAPGGDFSGHYRLGRPAWWNESADGPWWGGADPDLDDLNQLAGQSDLDRDGLLDHDQDDLYEDPMPFANHENAFRNVSYSGYDVPDPPSGATPEDPGLAPATRRLFAQAYLNPREIGSQYVHRPDSLSDQYARQDACMELDPLGASIVTKGTPVHVTGSLTKCAGGGPLQGVAVEARMGSNGVDRQTFGAAITDANGRFDIQMNIGKNHSLELPPYAGVFRGFTGGVVAWGTNPAIVDAGPDREIVVRSYVTPATAPYTDRVPAVRSAVKTATVSVRADSLLFLHAPPAAATGVTIPVTLDLHDSGGAPRCDPVDITWDGHTFTVTPRCQDGAADFDLSPVPADRSGDRTLHAASRPGPGAVSPGSDTRVIRLLRPAALQLVVPNAADAGTSLTVQGKLLTGSAGVAGSNVRVNLTSGPNLAATATAPTADDGSFSLLLALPVHAAQGSYVLTATSSPTPSTAATQVSASIRIRSLPIFSDVTKSNLSLGQPAEARARLLEPDGSPIAGAQVQVRLGDKEAAATTDLQGAFRTEFTVSSAPGPVLESVVFAGDSFHTPARLEFERTLLTSTRVELPDGHAARGGTARVPARLVDAAGRPIVGAPVSLQWASETPRIALTDANGRAILERPTSENEPLGPVPVRAEYVGSRDGGQAPSRASATWTVSDLAGLDVPGGDYDAGSPIPLARLFDVGRGTPLAHAPIRLVINRTETNATTDKDGRFPVVAPVPRDVTPFEVQILAQYLGNQSYASVERSTTLRIRSPVELVPQGSGTLVAGRPFLLALAGHDARGKPLNEGLVNLTWNGQELAAANFTGGAAGLRITLPPDAPAGRIEVLAQYAGTRTLSDAQVPIHLRVLSPVEIQVEGGSVVPGRTAHIRVLVTRAGQPLADAPVYLHVQGSTVGIAGTTDENGEAEFALPQPNASLPLVVRFAGDSAASPAATAYTLVPATPKSTAKSILGLAAWIAAAVAMLLAILSGYLVRARRHPLDSAFTRVRRTLTARGEFERQILFAYQVLEDTAISRELLTASAPTARALQEALAAGLPPSTHPALERLLTLFEDARYGTEPLTERHRDAAVAALDELVAELRRIGPTGFSTYQMKMGMDA